MRTYVAALALMAALVTVIYADPAEDARRAEMERAARKAAEDKKAAADEARREADARKSGEYARPVMVNNRVFNPITGKVLGTFKGGSTYLPAKPGALDNQFWIHDAGDSNITILVDANSCQAFAPIEPHFKVEGKKLTRTIGLILDTKGEGGMRGEAGEPWVCELPGRILTEKSPWYSEERDLLYVAYEGGVARIDNTNGKIEWKSPGASGRLYPHDEILFTAGDNGRGITEICARKWESGEITWTQSLGAGIDAEFMHVQETMLPGDAKAQYVLCVRNAGASPATRWFSLEGKPLMSISECAENVIYDNGRLIVLSEKRYAEIKRDGSTVWEVKRDKTAFEADAWIFTGNGAIRLQWGPIEDSGVKVTHYAYESAKPTWTHDCEALDVPHSKYWHKVYAKVQDEKLVVVSQAAGGNFIETLSLSDGKQVARHKP